ncbi:helicase-associated protein [Arthrobacter sp. CDRTa11]|nr:helicase-associated protein [Arthrobacter sp. CDRTa11]
MPKTHRRAPDPEWVEMYRRGISAARIAELSGSPGSTVRYHLRLAVLAEPDLRPSHQASLSPAPKGSKSGLANLFDVVALYQRERRLPSTKSKHPRERALAVWVSRRRQDVDRGTLDPVYARGLKIIPGWEQRTRRSEDEAQWNDRLSGLMAYLATAEDWPRHKNTDSDEEKVLGVWLQYQRTKLAAGQLDAGKTSQLDDSLPGWREGRSKGRKKAMS